MRVVTDLDQPPWPGDRAVITIGAYDGVHLGHQAVIDQVRERAVALDAVSAVVTFDRHPASVVRPESAPRLLTNNDQKMELLAATGIDAVVVVPFDAEQASETPESFVQRVLVDALPLDGHQVAPQVIWVPGKTLADIFQSQVIMENTP